METTDYQTTDHLELCPMSLKAANEYITTVHRHHGSTRGHKLSIGVKDQHGVLRGVVVLGRPVNRSLQDQGCIEVTRLATDGAKNACSMLYGAARRCAISMGYKPWQVVTYTLEEEPGSSLLASGWVFDGMSVGGTWNNASREREDKHPIGPKKRWRGGKK